MDRPRKSNSAHHPSQINGFSPHQLTLLSSPYRPQVARKHNRAISWHAWHMISLTTHGKPDRSVFDCTGSDRTESRGKTQTPSRALQPAGAIKLKKKRKSKASLWFDFPWKQPQLTWSFSWTCLTLSHQPVYLTFASSFSSPRPPHFLSAAPAIQRRTAVCYASVRADVHGRALVPDGPRIVICICVLVYMLLLPILRVIKEYLIKWDVFSGLPNHQM